jgi:catechol 2,3-dioxygenase-like lactoylglutathione lyase family enzyme
MRVEKIDHVHILIKNENLEKAVRLFADLMGTIWVGPLDAGDVRTAFDNAGLEFLAPKASDNLFAKQIEKTGEGIFSIAFKVPDLDEATTELEAKGVKCILRWECGDCRAAQFDLAKAYGIRANQFNPADMFGTRIELVEYDTVAPVALANLKKVSEIPFFRH